MSFFSSPCGSSTSWGVTVNCFTCAEGSSNLKSRKTRSQTFIKPRAPVFSSAANSAMRRKADLRLAQPLADDLLQGGESATDDEEDVLGVDDRRLLARTALSQVQHGLELAGDVVRGARRHVGFLHEFEQVRLHAASADVP